MADSLTCDMKRAANSETDKSTLFQKSISLYEVVTLVVYKQGWRMYNLTGEETRCKAVTGTSHAARLIQNYLIQKRPIN